MSTRLCYAVDPFDNIPAPQGLYFLDYPVYYTAQKIMDSQGNAVLDNLDLHSYQNIFRITYYNKTTFENTWAFTLLVPVGRIEMQNKHDEGLGDFTVASAYWMIDDAVSKTWLGAVAYVDIPTGSYDSEKTVNMGRNVWKFRPSLVFAKQFNNFDLEATAKYNIYTKNKDTDVKEGSEAIFEGYCGYFVKPNLLIGGHFNATFGQNKIVNDNKESDSGIRLYQAGPSIHWMIDNNIGFLFETIFDIKARNTTEGELLLVRLLWKVK